MSFLFVMSDMKVRPLTSYRTSEHLLPHCGGNLHLVCELRRPLLQVIVLPAPKHNHNWQLLTFIVGSHFFTDITDLTLGNMRDWYISFYCFLKHVYFIHRRETTTKRNIHRYIFLFWKSQNMVCKVGMMGSGAHAGFFLGAIFTLIRWKPWTWSQNFVQKSTICEQKKKTY